MSYFTNFFTDSNFKFGVAPPKYETEFNVAQEIDPKPEKPVKPLEPALKGPMFIKKQKTKQLNPVGGDQKELIKTSLATFDEKMNEYNVRYQK